MAQGSSARDVLVIDSLTPAKKQLRDFVAQLEDTLTKVESLHAHIDRNLAAGVTSVVLSDGHQLDRRCAASISMIEVTKQRVISMRTSDERGDQALTAYRAGLSQLADDLKLCQHDDSVAMAAKPPAPQRIAQISSSASDAVVRYHQVRDGLLRLLGIDLPIHGTIPPPRPGLQ